MNHLKNILITGASSGIGRAFAVQCAAAGHRLFLAARRQGRLEDLRLKCLELGAASADVGCLDVRDKISVEAMANNALEVFHGKIDVLVNNAGLAVGRDPLDSANIDDWERMLDTNVKGLLYCSRFVLPAMVAARDGHVINVGSVAGYQTYEGGAVYSASKFAVRALSESLRLDLCGKNIRVTEVAPGMVETEFSLVRFAQNSEAAQKVYQGIQPLTAEDIACSMFFAMNQPKHVNLSLMTIMPTAQASATKLTRT
jgi:3-hydroxy acid dehydrogenase / malonic semialdehyde reductase